MSNNKYKYIYKYKQMYKNMCKYIYKYKYNYLLPAASVHLFGIMPREAVGLCGGPGLDARVWAHVVALLPHVHLLLGPQVLALGLVALALVPSQGALHGVAHPRALGGAAGGGNTLGRAGELGLHQGVEELAELPVGLQGGGQL